ncbi:MAG: cysteine desulfurase [Bacteroidetes bacterium]|nr:cysteine desulfurase [Bacteroidota bacterium]
MKVYLDNAATTPMDKDVLEEMLPYMTDFFGNPSSIHAYGRKTKAAIEKSRKIIAKYLNASTAEVFFTGSGTESCNMIIKCAVRDLGVQRVISSKIEHHCVLHSVEAVGREGVEIVYVKLDGQGRVDYKNLDVLLAASGDKKTLVSLMHANNEIGTLLDLLKVSELCQQHNAFFHSDTVQTIGYNPFDLQQLKIHFLTGSAHKFHGPKGGFVYINNGVNMHPFMDGGSQERNMRAGTENVYGIVGLGKALEICINQMENYRSHIQGLKEYMKTNLMNAIPNIGFNGDTSEEGSNYKVLNVSLPVSGKSELMLFNLDMSGIAASGGSACSSGSEKSSHVLEAIGADPQRKSIRFSFSKYNTKEEIDYTVQMLKKLMQTEKAQTTHSTAP